uniref:Uncharacterized protein n=1 Tax=Chromera velia CCMP2878 TaxID=1169474 RepID=A0A0G4F3Z3_9ALVE|eukprot:Cvel_15037.t1-p1 / transcript=Cvel_15037.t1 / gene=Cvel_15037 / organism=Chromera_velia_CCMP2878 / gene_product=hypothetical protein / transcript_product=hypothetical protein / location=Cvel_scaffold1095:5996-8480(-) / protein_length=687 / sequence_SO=supercontig / SO=protein_coding / is_pseudo=false
MSGSSRVILMKAGHTPIRLRMNISPDIGLFFQELAKRAEFYEVSLQWEQNHSSHPLESAEAQGKVTEEEGAIVPFSSLHFNFKLLFKVGDSDVQFVLDGGITTIEEEAKLKGFLQAAAEGTLNVQIEVIPKGRGTHLSVETETSRSSTTERAPKETPPSTLSQHENAEQGKVGEADSGPPVRSSFSSFFLRPLPVTSFSTTAETETGGTDEPTAHQLPTPPSTDSKTNLAVPGFTYLARRGQMPATFSTAQTPHVLSGRVQSLPQRAGPGTGLCLSGERERENASVSDSETSRTRLLKGVAAGDVRGREREVPPHVRDRETRSLSPSLSDLEGTPAFPPALAPPCKNFLSPNFFSTAKTFCQQPPQPYHHQYAQQQQQQQTYSSDFERQANSNTPPQCSTNPGSSFASTPPDNSPPCWAASGGGLFSSPSLSASTRPPPMQATAETPDYPSRVSTTEFLPDAQQMLQQPSHSPRQSIPGWGGDDVLGHGGGDMSEDSSPQAWASFPAPRGPTSPSQRDGRSLPKTLHSWPDAVRADFSDAHDTSPQSENRSKQSTGFTRHRVVLRDLAFLRGRAATNATVGPFPAHTPAEFAPTLSLRGLFGFGSVGPSAVPPAAPLPSGSGSASGGGAMSPSPPSCLQREWSQFHQGGDKEKDMSSQGAGGGFSFGGTGPFSAEYSPKAASRHNGD